MSKKKIVYVNYPPYPMWPSNYGCFNLLLDVFMTIITCGLWIIWVLVRQSRR